MTTALISHPDSLRHVTPSGHPECIARIEAITAALADRDLLRIEAPLAEPTDITRLHSPAHLTALTRARPSRGIAPLDPDTWISPDSLEAAFRAVGGVKAGIDLVMAGEAQNAFVAMRPPGHHAETARPMGFCLFGNVALGAAHALAAHGLSRVAIVDFDVHHGNGTQDLLWDERRVLFVSSHQMPLWPGSGAAHETGAHDNILNVPLRPGTGSAALRRVYQEVVFPRLEAFAPELLLISAGFDAHKDDPLANLDFETEDFAWLTEKLAAIAARHAGGRIVSTLEGGYNLTALADSVAAHVDALIAVGQKG